MDNKNSISLGSFNLTFGNNPSLKKFGLPILLAIGVFAGAASPFWFTGGFVSNAHLEKTGISKFHWPGFGLGSKTIFVCEGQTIQVNVDVHEATKGCLIVSVREKFYRTLEKTDSAYRTIKSSGKQSVTLKAKRTGLYDLKFDARGTNTSKMDGLTGGKYDLKYSSDWDVL